MKFSRYLFICLILLSAVSIFAQTETEKGLELYRKGDYNGAINLLKPVVKLNKNDGDAWNTLGMAYLNTSKFKDGQKAIENATKQNPQNVAFQINLAYSYLLANKLNNAEKQIKKAIALAPKNATALYLRGTIYLRKGEFDKSIADADESLKIDKTAEIYYWLKANNYLFKFGEEVSNVKKPIFNLELLKKSIETLEDCLKNCSNSSNTPKNQTKINELRSFYKFFERRQSNSIDPIATNANPTNDPSITPIKVLSKPRPSYTDSARSAGVQGTVELAVLFSEDGKTKMVLVMKPLSNGLTEEAVRAAQKIEFQPSMKDGKPISVIKMVQFNFTLY